MNRKDSPPDHVTPYDRFAWSDDDVEQLLLSGEHREELSAYFGPDEYRELTRLTRHAHRTRLAGRATRVFIVPGIMGSQLGLRRRAPAPHDVVWLDPLDIGVGKLATLRMSAEQPIVPLGVVLYSYLRLKLYLRAGGFAPLCYDYDWRQGVGDLGAALAERMRREPAERVMIVAHSMGGLVSRAALTQPGMSKVARLVLLGTPNFGSFAPLQALRGTYSVVRKLAMLSARESPESLAADIFNSFPSLYHMLPVAERTGGPDLFDARQWPDSGLRPHAALLRRARALQDGLADADGRIATVVGVGQETVTSAVKRGNDFIYTITRHGDGTVPAVSAELPGAANHYTSVAHSELTRDPTVAAAVLDLLQKGKTRRLPAKWHARGAAQAQISDRKLRALHTDKVDWAALEPQERRQFLENLNEPPKLRLRVPARKRNSARRDS